MLKLFKTILKTGEATVKYPFKPLEVCPGFRGKPVYDAEQCIACGACTVACPANALTMETDTTTGERIWQIFYGRCIFCARCEEVCPTRAIVLSEEFELAVTQKADLYTTATFALHSCPQCNQPFTTKKALALTMDLLAQSSGDPDTVEALREVYECCPGCRQKYNLSTNGSLRMRQIAVGEKS